MPERLASEPERPDRAIGENAVAQRFPAGGLEVGGGRSIEDAALQAPVEELANEGQLPVGAPRRGAVGDAIEHVPTGNRVDRLLAPVRRELARQVPLLALPA